tara:strand:+ start:779 stop:2056 length:1278 start_codon:yes stop_codon:yes gene_type:complete
MKLTKNNLISLLFSIHSIGVFSQATTGSPYSLNELGEISFKGNVSSLSLGGVDSAIDSIEFNINNPSSLAKLKTTNYLVGTFYKGTKVSNNNTSDNITTSNINYIAVGIPLKKFGLGFGVIPYSSAGFNLQTTDEYNTDNSIDTRFFVADGNINRVFLSLGIPIFKYLSLGASANYNFGKFDYEKYNLYDTVNYGILDSSTSEIKGYTYTFSSTLFVPIKDDISFTLLYSFDPEVKLDSFNRQSVFTSTSASITLESVGDFIDVDLNSKGLENTSLLVSQKNVYSFGLEKKNYWYLGIQYENKLSSKFENTFLNLNNVSYRDTNSFAIGGYIIPDNSSLTEYWKRVRYSFGIKNHEKSIIVNNLPVNQFSLNLGLGLPLTGLSKANLAIEIGKTGSKDNSIKENYFALRLGLSLNDIWFIKRKYN